MFNENNYDNDIEVFEKVFSTKADELLSNEDLAVVYIGRGTCPYCRKFAKKLSSVAKKVDTTIYYVDSEDFSDDNISSFRRKYNVVTVPGFLIAKNNEITVYCDSSIPEEELLNMIK